MKVAVFGDISSNYEVLKKFFNKTEKEQIDDYWCNGDIVHHNDLDALQVTDKCIDLFTENDVKSVIGNHEEWLLDIINGTHNYSKAERRIENNIKAKGHKIKYSDNTVEYLSKLAYEIIFGDALLKHAPTLGAKGDWPGKFPPFPKRGDFPYKSDFEILESRDAKILFFGHTHKKVHFIQHTNFHTLRNIKGYSPTFDKEIDVSQGNHLVNPGNLHQHMFPWGYGEKGSYCIYETQEKTITYKWLDK